MKSVILHGTGGASRGSLGEIGFTGTAFGKTGTTDQNKDLWFIGSSPLYAGALWLGYDQPSNLKGSASDLAAPLWGWWMRDIHKGLSVPKSFSGMTLKNSYLCAQTGKYGNASCKTLPMPMRSGAKASGVCPEKHPPPSTEEKKYHSVWQKNP
jgi:membrane carboxypeptidase/penicillin-binding protein